MDVAISQGVIIFSLIQSIFGLKNLPTRSECSTCSACHGTPFLDGKVHFAHDLSFPSSTFSHMKAVFRLRENLSPSLLTRLPSSLYRARDPFNCAALSVCLSAHQSVSIPVPSSTIATSEPANWVGWLSTDLSAIRLLRLFRR